MMLHVVLLTGDRYWTDRMVIWRVLDWVVTRHPRLYLVEGGASGADFAGRTWRMAHDIPGRTFHADWDKHAKAAGPRRNLCMGQYVAGMNATSREVLAFHDHWDTSKGTVGMIEIARELGLRVRRFQHRR